MYSEHECGICYQTYNGGRRCPRELHCGHSFCESCLLALARTAARDEARRPGDESGGALIVCPLCRRTTRIPGEGKVRVELRVDERALERLLASGVLDQEEQDEPDCDDTEEYPETPAEESDSSTGSRGASLRWSCRKLWRLISGKSSRQRGGENCMTHEDLRDFAMMSCHMF